MEKSKRETKGKYFTPATNLSQITDFIISRGLLHVCSENDILAGGCRGKQHVVEGG